MDLIVVSERINAPALGNAFHRGIILVDHSGESEKGSCKFFLGFHCWFCVVSRTQELWGFRHHILDARSKRYQRSRTIPIDLVLNQPSVDGKIFNGSPGEAPRATRSHAPSSTANPLTPKGCDRLSVDYVLGWSYVWNSEGNNHYHVDHTRIVAHQRGTLSEAQPVPDERETPRIAAIRTSGTNA